MTAKTQSIGVTEPWPAFDEAQQETRPFYSLQSYTGGRILKRALDIVFAVGSLLLLLPLLLSVAVIVKISDRGPVFYSHRRIGHKGREFGCLKFRTMKTDAAMQLTELLAANPAVRAEWEATRKLKADPRVTAVGDILRKSSLDELPQLINVVLGQMSLVGPRPITKEELPRYAEHADVYLASRPGLTGHWQTSGRNDISYQHRVSLDVEYLSKWSLGWDFLIMAKTLPILFSRRGSY
ncbi:sugar transferase [Rhizobium herbae]|jgi:exopolysaccharide production protein ExoY